jgi:hypothetical protein
MDARSFAGHCRASGGCREAYRHTGAGGLDSCNNAPYRLEIVQDVYQPVLQAAPEQMTRLLLEHLSEHAR